MINNVVVTYSVRPDARDEHVRLIEAVFAQLAAERPDDVDYQVLCLDDGVSFVHVATADTADGSSPIPKLAAFQEFSREIAGRVTGPPASSGASVVGEYRGRS